MRRAKVAALLLLIASFTLPAAAQVPTDVNVGAILMCNEVVLRIRFQAGGLTVAQRVEAVRQRIIRAYANEQISAANIVARQERGEWVIYVGRQMIVTVDQNHARANNTTAAGLTQVWLTRLRDVMPRCRPDPNPPGSRP
jgi:hypothetical protein